MTAPKQEQTDAQEMERQTNDAAIDPAEIEAIAHQLEADEHGALAEELDDDDGEGPGTAEMLQPLIDMVCNVACPAWKVQKGERQALADAYGDLIDKYYPGGPGQWGPELNAGLITAAIFAPRVLSGQPRIEAPTEPQKTDISKREEVEG